MIIFGASGHGKVVNSAIQGGAKLFFDDNSKSDSFLTIKVEAYRASTLPNEKVVVAVGDNATRKKIVAQIDHGFGLVGASSAEIDPSVQLGAGSQILHASLIQAGTIVGKHCIVNSGASVDHDCVLEDFVHIAPNATLCGSIKVGEGSLIGAGAVVLPNITIGKWCIIGAGAVVTKDIKDNQKVYGNPAK